MPNRYSGELLRYLCIGMVNTCLHASVFALSLQGFGLPQGMSNLLGFLTAVTFSYFANARWTFQGSMSFGRYLTFTGFMALLAFALGQLGQGLGWPAPLTFCLFSGISLLLGFAFARAVVFKERMRKC